MVIYERFPERTDITYVVSLHAGERVTVYDWNLLTHFPIGATDVVTKSWEQAQDSGMPQCWNLQEVRSAAWTGSYLRCPRCDSRQRGGVTRCFTSDCGMVYEDVVRFAEKNLAKDFPPEVIAQPCD